VSSYHNKVQKNRWAIKQNARSDKNQVHKYALATFAKA